MTNFSNDRLILHCDLNNFYASVECLLRPDLKGVPMAVGGSVEKRHGIILAKNDIAKKLGVKTAEPIWQAEQKARGLILVPPHFELYSKFSKQVFEVYTRFTPLVEPFGPDECWLDATGCTRLFGSGKQIADKIRETVLAETGLTVSAGVSFNKVFAKMGSDLKKPNATSIVSRENFQKIIWPLPVGEMPGIGEKTAEKLGKMNLHTVGDLAQADATLLKQLFGVVGEHMVCDARGQNTEPVREAIFAREEQSIGHGMTTTRDLTAYPDAEAVIFYLCERISARLRNKTLKASGIALDLRDNEFSHVSRQKKLTPPSCGATQLAAAAIELLHANWACKPPIRTLTISAFDFSALDAAVQTSMFGDEKRDKAENLDKAIDAIKQKYGNTSILRGNLMGRDFIYDKTEAEDFLPFKR